MARSTEDWLNIFIPPLMALLLLLTLVLLWKYDIEFSPDTIDRAIQCLCPKNQERSPLIKQGDMSVEVSYRAESEARGAEAAICTRSVMGSPQYGAVGKRTESSRESPLSPQAEYPGIAPSHVTY